MSGNIADLIPRAPGLVARFLPQLKYLLIDENQYTEADLSKLKNLVAAIIRIEHPDSDRAVFDLIDHLNEWLADNPELRRIFAIWIRAVLLRQSKYTLALPKVHDLKELKMTLAERFDLWAQQHEQKGIEKGEALALQRFLAKRFGPIPSETLQLISSATQVQLETWVDRVVDAPSLADVFKDVS